MLFYLLSDDFRRVAQLSLTGNSVVMNGSTWFATITRRLTSVRDCAAGDNRAWCVPKTSPTALNWCHRLIQKCIQVPLVIITTSAIDLMHQESCSSNQATFFFFFFYNDSDPMNLSYFHVLLAMDVWLTWELGWLVDYADPNAQVCDQLCARTHCPGHHCCNCWWFVALWTMPFTCTWSALLLELKLQWGIIKIAFTTYNIQQVRKHNTYNDY